MVDLHCLRYSLISLPARSGVHPKTMQAMTRHSDPKLTLSRYTHVETADQAEALRMLPDLTTPDAGLLRATGTIGRPIEAPENNQPAACDGRTADSVLAFCLAFSDARSYASVRSHAPEDGASFVEPKRAEARESQSCIAYEGQAIAVRPGRIELPTYGLGNRCSIH